MLELLQTLGAISAHGALSEHEGMQLLVTLPRVDLVLIGGRYTEQQRARIRSYLQAHMPTTKITEPGLEYPYDDAAIVADVRSKLEVRALMRSQV